jgi:alkaline phosphatase
VYAAGPQAHLFRGLLQQHQIPHILAYAACIGQGITFCQGDHNSTGVM